MYLDFWDILVSFHLFLPELSSVGFKIFCSDLNSLFVMYCNIVGDFHLYFTPGYNRNSNANKAKTICDTGNKKLGVLFL